MPVPTALPPSATYRPLPTLPFNVVKANDEAEKPRVMQDQQAVLNQRYDLSNNPIPGIMMSAAVSRCRAVSASNCRLG